MLHVSKLTSPLIDWDTGSPPAARGAISGWVRLDDREYRDSKSFTIRTMQSIPSGFCFHAVKASKSESLPDLGYTPEPIKVRSGGA